ncbi:hypothetical protein SAMN06893096_102328 [Geodermatophilus pulveris]|uniref:Uncharacterized protein n=1 Tax=Geodermatophilus pulveris TaxID=1564159 RepID=A0A239CAP7_9ACTN|nr:hypothetical protein [Geodermatophilus pulveris]SNS16972.1 hypothetical protein SAMN06893096_102328 [Geodermatophilus pulveris]
MCGACGGARGPAAWEDVLAGAGPAQRAARAAATGRLLTGGRLRVTPWRGGYLLTTATGAARPVASLGELWAAARPPVPAPGGRRWCRAPAPAVWDPQAAAAWLAAAARAGTVTAAELPAGGVVEFAPEGTARAVPAPELARVGVRGPDPEAALAGLLAFAARP